MNRLKLALATAAALAPLGGVAIADQYFYRHSSTSPAVAVGTDTSGSPEARVGAAPTLRIVPKFGASSYRWTVAGTLPPGLSAAAGGFVGAASPGSEGRYPLRLSGEGPGGPVSRDVEINIMPKVGLSGPGEIRGRVNRPLPANFFSSSGIVGSAELSLEGGLPGGLSLSGSSIVGTPATVGGTTPRIVVRDSHDGSTATVGTSIQVNDPPSVDAAASVTGTAGSAIDRTFAASNVFGTAAWSASSLPAGLSLSTSGRLSGSPTQVGSGQFQVRVTDGRDGAQSDARSVAYAFAGQACLFDGESVPSGGSRTAYRSPTSNCSDTQQRTCTNGQLGGDASYAYRQCTQQVQYGKWVRAGSSSSSWRREEACPTVGATCVKGEWAHCHDFGSGSSYTNKQFQCQ